MASLNKLAIRGIRSFDDKHIQVIEFYSPLTVIVGHNGSGKTTIIECLKYATTGELPPNTKGGAFIHDPKMANEKEVKAQVRLRFWNVNRQRMTVTRSLQATVKKGGGGLTMKTLEGLLAKTEPDGGDGKRNTISTKCSELDEEVPLLLGASEAILENVIFCHQENSNWPFSEPAALKKKFDDIFEATKYTKALDNISKLRKERTQELKVDRERLKFLKADKDKAQRLRKELEEATHKENSKQTEVENLKEEAHRLNQRNMANNERASGFNVVFEHVKTLQQRHEMLTKNCDRMLEGMTVLKDSTDELANQYKNFDVHLKSIEAKRDKQVELRDKETEALEDLRRRERTLVGTQGGLHNTRKNHDRNIREREAAVRAASKTHNFPGYDYSPLEDYKVAEFVEKLSELVRKAETDLRRTQAEGTRKERELQGELDRLSSAKTTAIANKQTKLDQINDASSKIRQMEANFDAVSSVDADISVLENDISATSDRRDHLEGEIQQAKYDEQMRERLAARNQKETDKDKLNSELTALNRQADTRAQLAIKRTEMQNKSAQVAASVQSHGGRFRDLVGSDLDPSTMEDRVTGAVSRKDRELQDAEASSAANNRSLSQLQTSLTFAKQALKAKQDELAKLERSINDALEENGQESIDMAIAEAQQELSLRQDEVADTTNSLKFYRKILDMGKTKKKCLGCDRAIHGHEVPKFESYLEARIAKCSSSDLSEVKEELAQWQSELDKFRALQPSVATIKTIKEKDIPSLERQVAHETSKLEKVKEEVEQSMQAVQTAKMATRDLHTLKSAAVIVSRTVSEIEDLKTDIERLERGLESSGSLKTIEEVQQEIDQLSSDIKVLQREHQQLSADKELKYDALRRLSDEHSRKSLKLGELRSKQERRRMDQAALHAQKDHLTKLQGQLRELDAAAAAAVAPWREKNDQLDRYRSERHATESDASDQVAVFQSTFNEVEQKHRICQNYVTEGIERKIRETEAHLDDIKREINATLEAQMKIDGAISSLQDDISQASITRKNIKSNLDYREESREIEKVMEELQSIDVEESARARREFNSKYKKDIEEETSVKDQWQLASGVLLQMRENRKKMESTLKADYRNIDKEFREQLIKTKTSEVANNDLEKYGKALDNAILKYHSIKMDEINDTIGHLWSKTYQGTDIDTVRIVADHDENSTSTRKNYNYRVVMVKDDVELDMRGRCSAGQKVLASIIIRLALAESFGQGCGVLALDEPTTNLDQENINALAESLAEIIRDRRRQANFQLIVITHDEGFLQRLAAFDVLEYYWRVSRNASQKSILERQRIGI